MKIALTQGKYAIVDPEDYERVIKTPWHYSNVGAKGGYAHSKLGYMHRFILGDECEGKEVDHINRDTLDNRKSNLRSVDRTLNSYNKGLQSNNTSGSKGVAFHKPTRKWRARIIHKGHEFHLGLFGSKIDAEVVYLREFQKLSGLPS